MDDIRGESVLFLGLGLGKRILLRQRGLGGRRKVDVWRWGWLGWLRIF
jgi:hypothetical protein